MDFDATIPDYADAYASIDFEPVSVEASAERYARGVIEYLRENAGHDPTLRLDDHLGVINEVTYRLAREGYATHPDDDGDERVSVFVAPRFLTALRESADDLLMSGGDETADGTRVHGARVYADSALGRDELIAIHHDAIIPSPAAEDWRPYLVRNPSGVVFATIETSGE